MVRKSSRKKKEINRLEYSHLMTASKIRKCRKKKERKEKKAKSDKKKLWQKKKKKSEE